MSKSHPTAEIITAGLRPELFSGVSGRRLTRRQLIVLLSALVLAAFALRGWSLGAESLGEDELNKLMAVTDYRAHGLTSANGEHPFLMKALQTASIVIAEKWNESGLVNDTSAPLHVSVESALRLPSVICGSLIVILLYLLTSELFGMEVGLLAAALWAFEPSAIAFSRIAKEDIFFLFFFLLANIFWLRGQRVAEGEPERNPQPYYWATGATFGAMMASKYLPHLIAVSVSYNYIFQGLPATRWVIGKKRYLILFAVMGGVFLLCNPTILLPGTWREMFAFASYQKLGHDSYEFMGQLYPHRVTDWLGGLPWYFYFVFVGVKTTLPTLIAFVVGLPLVCRREYGDGRFFLLFWAVFGFITFCLLGGKFTRYLTISLPLLYITAALGIQFVARVLARRFQARFTRSSAPGKYLLPALASLLILPSIWAAVSASPHERLYTNLLGGGQAHAADYFPQDDFYDAQIGPAIFEIARRAQAGARVASETPGLAGYYAARANRSDLRCVSSSDQAALAELQAGDFIVAAKGRRYFSNEKLLSRLQQSAAPAFQLSLGGLPAADIYLLELSSLPALTEDR